MKLENRFGFMHINSTPKIREGNDLEKIIEHLSLEEKNTKFYLENTNKLEKEKMAKGFRIRSINLWIFSKGKTYNIGCNLTSKNFSEIYIYFVREMRIPKPKKHFIEFSIYNIMMVNRTSSLVENDLFYDELMETLESSEATPIMSFNEWKDFIEPYDYYKKLKVELMAKDFYVTALNSKNITKGTKYSSRKESEGSIKFFGKGELGWKIYISDNKTNSSKKINYITEINEVSAYDNEGTFKQKDRGNFIKKLGNKLSIFAIDTKTEPLMVDNMLGKLTSRKNDKDFIGATSKIEEVNEVVNSQNNLLKNLDKKFEEEIESFKNSIKKHSFKEVNLVGEILDKTKSLSETRQYLYKNKFIDEETLHNFKDKNTTFLEQLSLDLEKVDEAYFSINSELPYLESEYEQYLEKDNEYKMELKSQKQLIDSLNKESSHISSEIKNNSNNILNSKTKLEKVKEQEVREQNSKETFEKKERLLILIKELEKESVILEKKSLANKELIVLEKTKETKIENKRDKETQIFNDMYLKMTTKFFEKNIDVNYKSILNLIKNLMSLLEDINKILLTEVKSVQEIIYYFNEKISEKETYIYLIDRSSTILMDTIYKTISKVQRDGMNNPIVKMIAEKDAKMDPNNGIETLSKYGKHLNEEQMEAYYKAINPANKLTVIQGPPGTGKTEIITELIRHFRGENTKVILSSQTNEAISNVIEKLLSSKDGPIMTFWSTSKKKNSFSFDNISETWYEKTFIKRKNDIEKGFDKTTDAKDLNILKEVFEELNEFKVTANPKVYLSELPIVKNANVIGATTTTSTTNYGESLEFIQDAKVLIIDEVSKSILIEILRYSIEVEKVILVGDYKQLSPMFDLRESDVESLDSFNEKEFNDVKKRIEEGVFYDVSKRANNAGLNTQLVTNYRSIEEVLNSYKIFYGNDELGKELIPFRENETQYDEMMKKYNFSNASFFEDNISRYFVNIDDTTMLKNERTKSRHNEGERKKIVSILKDLLNTQPEETDKSLGLIFMYGEQLMKFKNENRDLINKLNATFKGGFRINTVDGYQGSESDIIIVATTFVGEPHERSFLINYRRLNVALSRAKDILVIMGSAKYLSGVRMNRDGKEEDTYLKEVIHDIKKSNRSKFIEGMVN